MNLWDQLRSHLQRKVSPESYETGCGGTSFAGLGRLHPVGCGAGSGDTGDPGGTVLGPLEERHQRTQITDTGCNVRDAGSECQSKPEFHEPGNPGSRFPNQSAEPLNSPFRTSSWGLATSSAVAAAKSVAQNPSRSYNPLFLYGGVGMGKTHLMHAIGRELMDRYGSMRVIYTSSERFMNEMIACIRTERMQQFHQRYREADVLLVDDIQVLGSKSARRKNFSIPSTSCTTTRSRS